MKETDLTFASVAALIEELGRTNAFWANELTLMGAAVAFDLDLEEVEIEDLTAVLFDDEYGDGELDLVTEVLNEREADVTVLTFAELREVADRYGCELNVLTAEVAELTAC